MLISSARLRQQEAACEHAGLGAPGGGGGRLTDAGTLEIAGPSPTPSHPGQTPLALAHCTALPRGRSRRRSTPSRVRGPVQKTPRLERTCLRVRASAPSAPPLSSANRTGLGRRAGGL